MWRAKKAMWVYYQVVGQIFYYRLMKLNRLVSTTFLLYFWHMLRHVRAFRSQLFTEEQTFYSKSKGKKESIKCDGHTGRQFFSISKTISSAFLEICLPFLRLILLKKLEALNKYLWRERMSECLGRGPERLVCHRHPDSPGPSWITLGPPCSDFYLEK